MRARVDGPAGRRQGCREHHPRDRHRSDDEHAHRDMRGQRPACCCGRDDGDRANRGDREGHRSRRRRPRVARGMAEQQREKAADKNGRPGEVPKARAREQIDRPQAQVGGHEERANQIPDAIQRLTPADGASEELRAGADAVEQEPDPPDQLERVAPLPPLVEHHRGEDKAQDRRAQRQHDVQHVHEKASTIATLTSFKNHPTFSSRSARPTFAAPSSATLVRTMPSKRWNARIASPSDRPASRASSA